MFFADQSEVTLYNYFGYSVDFEFTIQYEQCIGIAGNLRWETIQGILFDILLMEYNIEIYGILIRISNNPLSV